MTIVPLPALFGTGWQARTQAQALRLALSLAPEVVYLLTDADDLSDADRALVTHLNRGRAVIHTIELNTSNRDRTDRARARCRHPGR